MNQILRNISLLKRLGKVRNQSNGNKVFPSKFRICKKALTSIYEICLNRVLSKFVFDKFYDDELSNMVLTGVDMIMGFILDLT